MYGIETITTINFHHLLHTTSLFFPLLLILPHLLSLHPILFSILYLHFPHLYSPPLTKQITLSCIIVFIPPYDPSPSILHLHSPGSMPLSHTLSNSDSTICLLFITLPSSLYCIKPFCVAVAICSCTQILLI